jgi:hypothetical protein
MSKVDTDTPSVQTMRSININLDMDHPDRLVGYIPTRKSVALSEEVLKGIVSANSTKAFAVAAPYGSGKSSAGLLWCQLVEKTAKDLAPIKGILETLKSSKESGATFSEILKRKKKGLAVPLEGFSGSISEMILKGMAASLKRTGQIDLAGDVGKFPKSIKGLFEAFDFLSLEGRDSNSSIVIVWDEFGKVLEHAAAVGDAKILFEVQTLAEYVNRTSKKFPVVLALLLHQSFARYASNLPAYVRTEWAKIEGRFKQINYIEDSKEIYELISQVIARGVGSPNTDRPLFKRLAKQCHAINIFKDFDLATLEEVLWSAAPLTPIALYLLPRISARVAQNERTLFSFLCSDETNSAKTVDSEWITPEKVYDFFSDLMRVDTSVGGTHRQWVETNLAINKSETEDLHPLLKNLATIKIGTGQSPLVANEQTLALAVADPSKEMLAKIKSDLQELQEKKIVFYRRLNNEYSIWQGSDVDIRSAVGELKARFDQSLDLKAFLSSEYIAPFRYPQRHNDTNAVRRYFDGRYMSIEDLAMVSKWGGEFEADSSIRDGRINYVLAETKEELAKIKKMAKAVDDARIVFAVPRQPLAIRDIISELKAYHQLLADPEFAGQDPVIDQELRQLADEVEVFLKKQIDNVLTPSPDGPLFVAAGEIHKDIHSMGGLKRFLSTICDDYYELTPRFNNEMVNKAEPSAQIVNARKKLIRAILADYGQENFGLDGYGPEVSIFRAIFLKTGIYRQNDAGEWGFAEPRIIRDQAIREIWLKFVNFWSKPDELDKDPELHMKELKAAPYGMREGLFSVLFAAAYKYSHAEMNILEDGVYVAEVKAETFERILRNPAAMQISVPPLNEEYRTYLNQVIETFAPDKVNTRADRIRLATAGIMRWVGNLPKVARERDMVSNEVNDFIQIITRAKDPSKLHKVDLLEASGVASHGQLVDWLKRIKTDVENVEVSMIQTCKESILRTVGSTGEGNLQLVLTQWIEMLPGDVSSYKNDSIMSGFLTRSVEKYANENLLIRSLAELFAGRPLSFWDKHSLAKFEASLHSAVKSVEDMADQIDLESVNAGGEEISVPWTERRLTNQLKALDAKLGRQKTMALISNILERIDA